MPGFDQRGPHVEHQINVSIPPPRSNLETRPDPFTIVDTQGLLGVLPSLSKAQIPYLARPSTTPAFEDLVRRKRLLLSGRAGIGKTREAIRMIQLLEAEHGEPFSVMLISSFPHDPRFGIETIATAAKNLVVFLDDCHLLARRYAQQHSDD